MFGSESQGSIYDNSSSISASPFDSKSPFDSTSSPSMTSPFDFKSPFDSTSSPSMASPFDSKSPFDAPSSSQEGLPSLTSSIGLNSADGPSNLTNLNGRIENYGGNSVIDAMRGAQGRRLNNNAEAVSLAEMYGDASLDTRFAGGAYNVTLSDIYADRNKFEVAMGIQTGMILRDRENDDLEYNSQLDSYGNGNIKTKNLSPFSKESIDLNNGKVLSPFSRESIDLNQPKIAKSVDSLIESYQKRDEDSKNISMEENILPFGASLKKHKSYDDMVESTLNSSHSEYIREMVVVAGIKGLDNGKMNSEEENAIVQEFRKKPQEEKLKMIKDNKLPNGLPVAEKQKVLSEQKKIEEKEKKEIKKKNILDAKIKLKADKRKASNLEFENKLRNNGSEKKEVDKKEVDKKEKLNKRKKSLTVEEAIMSFSGVQREIKMDDKEDDLLSKISKNSKKENIVLESQNIRKVILFDEEEEELKELVSEIKKTSAPHVVTKNIQDEDKSKKIERFRESDVFDYEEETEEVKEKKKRMSKNDILSKILK